MSQVQVQEQAIKHPSWLPIIMRGSFSEIYVLDSVTLRFVQVNDAAQLNLQYKDSDLIGMSPLDISEDLTAPALENILQPLRDNPDSETTIEAIHLRRDGTSYPIEFRLFLNSAESPPVFIAIGNDISSRRAQAEALGVSESRFSAMVSNMPGLVYQFLLRRDGSIGFTYLSDGCQSLLGLAPDQLSANPSLFLNLILPEDRKSYLDSMATSANDMSSWNWEGRIWIDVWKDIKWINLRSTPRRSTDNNVKWEGIMTNITQSKLAEFEIKDSRAHLAELSAHIEKIKEQERTRIAREIHDDLGGNLTAIKMSLALLTRRLPPDNAALLDKAEYVDLLVDRTIEAAHRISADLRPGVLDFGIVAALEWQSKEFEKQAGIPCIFTANEKEINLHLDQATAIFRIFQEALTNIAKHAHASSVTIRLLRNKATVNLKIADNGRGIAAADREKSQSFGIRGMIERAKALGGTLSVGPGRSGGNLVSITIPIHSPNYSPTHGPAAIAST
ncbi:MAG: histidine kinase [Pseudomonadota bacterium]